ncbi:hypothetical protein PR001_g26477 [Phytophthora rubi]|uniref:OTU domain-containing protein n=1 Tax=Phytophthora rubi TaxID=129364 RepID=A0A6A3I745_9STRA|nr:hypothetical protein PR001_g26477 [Phytophthora rubi]KAE8978040.1 hypothetical protein PR002_g24834 [Phytophthora rubi]
MGDTATPAEIQRLYSIATAAYPLHADSALRPMTSDEVATMDAYVNRRLELPAPPTFLSCTATGLKRAAMLVFHHEHVEAALIADVPANVRLGKYISRQSILRELVAANGGDEAGRLRMKRFIKAAQRIQFDGEHTLTVIFMSHRAASEWDGSKLRLRGQYLHLNLVGAQVPGICPPPQLARHYAVRVLGTDGLNAVRLLHVFQDITQLPVLDVRHPGLNGLAVADNDYWTVIFSSTACPVALEGVSSVILGDKVLTLHHFQRTQTPPCWRCFNPQHMYPRCKVTDARLPQVRTQRQREYVGGRGTVDVARLPDCRDIAALSNCLSTLADPLPPLSDSSGASSGSTEALRAVAAPTATTTGDDNETVAESRQEAASRSRPPTDPCGMTVVRRSRRGAPRQGPTIRDAHEQPDATQREPASRSPSHDRITSGPTIGQAVARQPSAQGRNPQRNHSRPVTKAEEAAQRYRATLDAYRELAADTDSDSKCEDAELKRESSCENTQTPTSLDPVRVAREHAVLLRQQESKTEDSPPVAVEHDPVHPDVEMDDAGSGLSPGEEGDHNGQVIAPACPNVFADIHSPSSETQPSREPYWHKASPVTPTPMDTDDLVAETAPESDSDSDGFVVEKVVAAVDDHRRTYQEWIGSLHGVPVSVPANGQCLFLAFYASAKNILTPTLSLTSTTIADANVIKQRVLDIVLANLRYDVHLELVDPREELRRLYPGEEPPRSVKAAAAALFAHYAKMRTISVATKVPQTFWEGPNVLRAMAVYLREPVYVWDIDAEDIAHVQQYSYQTFEMDNGDRHETGVVNVLTDDRIRGILEACFNHHVIPTMLLLKHTEGHFYGVQHGHTFHEWHAQRGPAMRERLDTVHRKVGLPVLKSDGYEPESITEEAALEEQALLEEMGVDFYASGSQESAAPEPYTVGNVCRSRPGPNVGVHRDIYERLLRCPDLDSMNAIDSRLAKRLHSDNDSAFAWWIAHEGSNYSIPKTPEGQRPWLALLDWMCEHPAAMHHVLAYLPFPEIAAQCCTPAQLAQWGERELYLVQIQTLERIWTDDDSDDQARDLCSAWLDRCKSALALEALDIASDRTQWGALSELVDASLLRLRPLEIPLEHWFILHVLPFAVADWTASPMGRAPTSAMALWYNEYNSIQRLCTDIADNRDWSAAARLSLGVTQIESPPTAAAAADHGGDSAARRK